MKFFHSFSLALCLIAGLHAGLSAQQQPAGQFSGDLELNTNFFIRDTLIGASGTPQYDRQKSGTESWLTLNYSNWGFDIGMRFDLFNNSNIIDPNDSYSALGIGRWHIRKNIQNLHIAAGYIYDQIGSGILFRAYEARPLAIDNALVGVRLQYDINKDWKIRAFSGKQKKVEKQRNLFEIYDPLIIGGAIDGFISFSDSSSVHLAPGAGALKRTIDDASMNTIISNINSDSFEYRFIPQYNTYAFTVYNTLTAGDFSWYVEGAYKTQEAIPDPSRVGYFQNKFGWVGYTSLSYSRPGFGITLQGKHTDNFFLRVSPLMVRNRGQIAYLPPMQRQNTYRLTARYNAATQELGEWAFLGDILINPSKKLGFALNYAQINDNNGKLLFREAFLETTLKLSPKQKIIFGLQYQQYNQEIYEVKPDAPLVEQFTPFVEYVRKFDKKRSMRIEAQYMSTRQDLGAWAFLLLEFNIAPHWSFTIADLLNTDPRKLGEVIEKPQTDGSVKKQSPIHYPTVAIFYTYKAYRAALSFVKQPQGVVCTGGICRLEPAFSGVRFNLTARF